MLGFHSLSEFPISTIGTGIISITTSGDTHDGADHHHKFHLPIYIGSGHRKQPLGNLIRIYNEAKKLEGTESLLSAVEPFLEISKSEEPEKAAETDVSMNSLPTQNQREIESLLNNQIAIDRLLNEIDLFNERLKRQKMLEDDLLLITISACI